MMLAGKVKFSLNKMCIVQLEAILFGKEVMSHSSHASFHS